MLKVNSYKTDDGEIFKEKKEALKHETELNLADDLIEYIEFAEFDQKTALDIIEWVLVNKARIKKLYRQEAHIISAEKKAKDIAIAEQAVIHLEV
jgi:hypothetical protein